MTFVLPKEKRPQGPDHRMVGFGRHFLGVGLPVLCGAILMHYRIASDRYISEFLIVGVAASALGALMWIVGTVEERLIEIRDRMPMNDGDGTSV